MNSAYEKQIGQKIRELRMEQGLSQDQLSAQMQIRGCNVSRSALAKIEVGQRHLYPDEIRILKEILKTTYDELFSSGIL